MVPLDKYHVKGSVTANREYPLFDETSDTREKRMLMVDLTNYTSASLAIGF